MEVQKTKSKPFNLLNFDSFVSAIEVNPLAPEPLLHSSPYLLRLSPTLDPATEFVVWTIPSPFQIHLIVSTAHLSGFSAFPSVFS
jgi:hypothetical protein